MSSVWDYPVHTRVVSVRERNLVADVGHKRVQVPVGSRGTVIGRMIGVISNEPRLLVLFDGEDFAVNMKPSTVRKIYGPHPR